MSDKESRIYDVEDKEMFDSANTFSDELANYYARFTTLNPIVFDEYFHELFREALKSAEAIPTDNVLIDKQAKETEDTHIKRKQCVGEVSLAKYYIDLAFEGRATIMNQFGYNDLKKVRKSTNGMIRFMSDFNNEVKSNIDTLVASGYPATKPKLLDQLLAELSQERSEQKEASNNRHRMTETRIHAQNHVWELMQVIADAKTYALHNDPVGQAIFTLPRPATSTPVQE